MSGTVVTFYSYKGGVGRTFALANAAVLLGRWGFRVLCIDWDLEAPGLLHFFNLPDPAWDGSNAGLRNSDAEGLVELFTEFRTKKAVPMLWRDYVIATDSARTPRVSLMSAGRADSTYSKRLNRLNWNGLYRAGMGDALEVMFEELRAEFDFIFIDSRTGITDFSGIVTAQLPDVLAFLFTANWQSLRGSLDVAARAVAARNELAVDRSRLLLLPIPARYEVQLEHNISAIWRDRYVSELSSFYDPWAFKDADIAKLVQATTIPYVPFWSFGERLSVVEDSASDPLSINYSLETVAALLAHRLSNTRLLIESRDEFVAAARRLAGNRDRPRNRVFISHTRDTTTDAKEIARSLARRGIDTFVDALNVQTGTNWSDTLNDAIGQSDHMIVLLGEKSNVGRYQEAEVRTFLRQSAADEGARLLIPISTGDLSEESVPTLLRNYKVTPLGHDYDKVADTVSKMIAPTMQLPSTRPGSSGLAVRITAEGDTGVEGASVTAQSSNGTTVDSTTSSDGRCTLTLLDGYTYTLMVAHPQFAGRIVEEFGGLAELSIRLHGGAGSVVMHSTGYIPGLVGRLNPILDTSDRTYLYAHNIAIDGGRRQPATFKVGEPIELEDSRGSRFQVTILRIAGRTSLVQYKRISSDL